MDMLKKILRAATIGFLAVTVLGNLDRASPVVSPPPVTTLEPTFAPQIPVRATPPPTDALLAQAFQQRQGNFQITGTLPVSRLLPDDRDGSRHQKFILQTSTGQTVLVAHNVDIAPRIPSIQVGDIVEFNGEYEWNEKGGVIHCTHHDPDGRHIPGWLRHRGATWPVPPRAAI